MMESRTQAIIVRLDGLLGNRSGSKNGEPNSGELDKEPTRNFNEQPNRRRTYGSTRRIGRKMLAIHYTPLLTNAPILEELRLKSKENLLLKPQSRSGYYKNNYGNFHNGPANQGNNWY